ncbi:hypothetical protein AYI68_g3739 [Smittium mucronatum]|uniref:Uncharacterized protein n=1 Tax=Smittium mucronatum TaxID=133383 RepID=A0A1R0GZ06_9FUNG|nr:hypothetical protein AYI68_g3739 [Smittium mucronatum]
MYNLFDFPKKVHSDIFRDYKTNLSDTAQTTLSIDPAVRFCESELITALQAVNSYGLFDSGLHNYMYNILCIFSESIGNDQTELLVATELELNKNNIIEFSSNEVLDCLWLYRSKLLQLAVDYGCNATRRRILASENIWLNQKTAPQAPKSFIHQLVKFNNNV